MPRLSRIFLYPVKSLPGVSVGKAQLTARGGLAHDREFVLLGAGGVINGKRCVVPTRDPSTGYALSGFQRTFVERRSTTLPAWANPAQFDFYYRFATNTRAAGSTEGKFMRVGDNVEI